MKKENRLPWVLSYSFYMFFTFYLAVKFIFIFFFYARQEPDFIFKFTPGYLISGFENTQLLFLAFIVFVMGAYFHSKPTKKNIVLSFICTIILLSGIGLSISSMDFSMSNLLYYIIFILLILVILIDHRRLLDHPETLLDISDSSILKEFSDIDDVSLSKKPVLTEGIIGKTSLLPAGVYADKSNENFMSIIKNIDKKNILSVSYIPDEVYDNKREKLHNLEKEIEERRKKLLEQEKIITDLIVSASSNVKEKKSYNVKKTKDVSFEEFDDLKESAAIIQRGKMKKINESLAELIGYDVDEMVDKNMIHFIIPEDFSKVEDFYLKRLKGKAVSSFETAFKTKDNKKINVSVRLKPVIYNGKKAEIIVFKKIKK